MPRTSPARLVAYDVLRDVDERDAYANLALPARIREARLDSRDAALATELVGGTLRWQGRYDRIIEIAARREVTKIDARTLRVLRLGVHQLLSMRTASHAAINESVELQRKVANQAAAGFVNGVLRTVDRHSGEEWDERITEHAKTTDDALAARTSHPVWIVRALRAALKAEGRESELTDLLEADNVSPRVSLAVLPGSAHEAAMAAAQAGTQDHDVELARSGPSPLGLELRGGNPAVVIEAIAAPEGTVRVQDQGSQLAALALSRARPVVAGERWLDLCAGPGGKTAVLAAEAAVTGATLRANEVSGHRAQLVRQAVAAHADQVDVVVHDGRDDAAFGDGAGTGVGDGTGTRAGSGVGAGASAASFDRILVDAPCSGLGALRRRSEARWRKKPTDLPELTQLQTELLDAAAEHLAPGGILAYVTCSPHLAETRVVLESFLKKHPELNQINTKAVLQQIARDPLDLAGDSLSAQLWPHRNGTDAMFIALLQRAD